MYNIAFMLIINFGLKCLCFTFFLVLNMKLPGLCCSWNVVPCDVVPCNVVPCNVVPCNVVPCNLVVGYRYFGGTSYLHLCRLLQMLVFIFHYIMSYL